MRRAIAVVIDVAALIAFVAVGLREHAEAPGIVIVLRNAVPILACWLSASLATGVYQELGVRTLISNWIVSIPTAVAARSLWVGSPSGWRFATFMLVALGFTLLFLLAGRLVVRLLGLGPPLGLAN
jgi:hypothetical protein